MLLPYGLPLNVFSIRAIRGKSNPRAHLHGYENRGTGCGYRREVFALRLAFRGCLRGEFSLY